MNLAVGSVHSGQFYELENQAGEILRQSRKGLTKITDDWLSDHQLELRYRRDHDRHLRRSKTARYCADVVQDRLIML